MPSDVPDLHSTHERSITDLRGLGPLVSLGRYRYLAAHEALAEQVHRGLLILALPLRSRFDFVLDGRTVPVEPGELVRIPPGTVYTTGIGAQPRGELLWLLLDVDVPPRDADGLGVALAQAVEDLAYGPEVRSASPLAVDLLGRVLDELPGGDLPGGQPRDGQPPDDDGRARQWGQAMCTAAVLELVRPSGRPEARTSAPAQAVHPGLRRATAWIEAHLDEQITIDRLVDAAGMSSTNFYHQFTRTFKTTPKDYVLRAKIARAENLLRTGNESITSIAHALGFSSSQQFGTAFRRYTGLSPSQYRAAGPGSP